MKYELLSPIDNNRTALETVLSNRGIPKNEMFHYLNTTDEDINDWRLLGEENIKCGIKAILNTANEGKTSVFIVDCDIDGYTSSAILINYLYDLFPAYVENNITLFFHSGKQHGLGDVPIDELPENTGLVLCPDSSSNDYDFHRKLKEKGVEVLVLDHHEAPRLSENAIVINNQLSDYPNKMFSGAGVVWQFCRAMDELLDVDFANKYIDLAACGLVGDMVSLTSIETKHVVSRGLEELRNPFFFALRQQNSYSIGPELTPDGCGWYLAPYVNAIVRSGTLEEKKLVFRAMLNSEAFKYIPSTKRGHKEGEMEQLYVQAIRVVMSVKRRQGNAEEAGMALLEKLIEKDNMLEEPVLIFTVDKSAIEPNIRGLAANKIQSKYQRPTIVTVENQMKDGTPTYAGSARNYGRSVIKDFRGLLEKSGLVNYAQGHANAFGTEFLVSDLPRLKEYFRAIYKDVPKEPTYYVDYIFNANAIEGDKILDIARHKKLWGQDFDEPLIAIENVEVTARNVVIRSREKRPMLVINKGGIEIIKFGISEEELDLFDNLKGSIALTIIGNCGENKWGGSITPQVKITDYEIKKQQKYIF